MLIYRVKNWDEHFENNRTRELKELRFVCLPNKHDGDGYTELLDHPSGPAHFGAWCGIVQIASKCVPRGTLLRSGNRPHDSASLARQLKMPKRLIDAALPRLLQIEWLEAEEEQGQLNLGTIPQEGAILPHARAGDGLERIGEEGIGPEGEQKIALSSFPVIAGTRSAGGEWQLMQKHLDELQDTFRGVDVLAEARKARQWIRDNPTKRKTAKGMPAFLSRWMTRTQNRGGGGGNGGTGGQNSSAQRRSDKLGGRDYEQISSDSRAYDDPGDDQS